MSVYDEIAAKIIKEQELLMGPVAWFEAEKVTGLGIIDKKKGVVEIEKGNNADLVLNKLVDRFGVLFGPAGREVCKDAARSIVATLKPSQVPASLK